MMINGPIDSERQVSSITVHDKFCIGCRRYGKALMVSIATEQVKGVIFDFFLTEEQAADFHAAMVGAIRRNSEASHDYYY